MEQSETSRHDSFSLTLSISYSASGALVEVEGVIFYGHKTAYMQMLLPRRPSGCNRPTPNEPAPRCCSSCGPSLWWHSLQPSLSILLSI